MCIIKLKCIFGYICLLTNINISQNPVDELAQDLARFLHRVLILL